MNAAAPTVAKDATKDKAGKPKEVKTGSTKTVTKNAPAHEDAEDAELHDKETAETLGKAAGKAEDDDARDYEELLSWKAGERRLREEEQKIKFRTMLKEKDANSSFKRIREKRKV